MKLARICGIIVSVLALCSHAQAALLGRLPVTPGGTDYQAYYDTILDITWASSANLSGADTWDNQIAWVTTLTIGGVDGWRLADMDVNGDGEVVDCAVVGPGACRDNEYGFHLYRNGITADTPGPFIDLVSGFDNHWSQTELDGNPDAAWWISFTFIGSDGASFKSNEEQAWAVHDGDVSAIPIPATVLLLGSALGLLAGRACRRRVGMGVEND